MASPSGCPIICPPSGPGTRRGGTDETSFSHGCDSWSRWDHGNCKRGADNLDQRNRLECEHPGAKQRQYLPAPARACRRQRHFRQLATLPGLPWRPRIPPLRIRSPTLIRRVDPTISPAFRKSRGRGAQRDAGLQRNMRGDDPEWEPRHLQPRNSIRFIFTAPSNGTLSITHDDGISLFVAGTENTTNSADLFALSVAAPNDRSIERIGSAGSAGLKTECRHAAPEHFD